MTTDGPPRASASPELDAALAYLARQGTPGERLYRLLADEGSPPWAALSARQQDTYAGLALTVTGEGGERAALLESALHDTLWMAFRYARGRRTYAPWLYNRAARTVAALAPDIVAAIAVSEDGAFLCGDLPGDMTAEEAVDAERMRAWARATAAGEIRPFPRPTLGAGRTVR